jgi:hypothetical protein
VVFSSESSGLLAFLSSGTHAAWVWKQASSLESRLRYTPSDCFETMPLPNSVSTHASLCALGASYDQVRKAAMESRHIGLTAFYNLFHDPEEKSQDICAVREMQDRIDAEVLSLYGWSDLAVGSGFHVVDRLAANDNVRYELPASIRDQIVQRLSALNKELTKDSESHSDQSDDEDTE